LIKKALRVFDTCRKFFFYSLIFLLLLGNSSSVFAGKPSATDSLRIYYLGEVVVSAKKGATVTSSALREINFNEIRREGVLNVAQAVELTLGSYVSVGSRNEMMVQLRGVEQRQISVMLDGVPIYVPYDGLVDLGQIPVTSIGKITITPGNSSVLYGPNSLGGSINILTSMPAKRNSRLRFFWGSGEMQQYSLQQSFSLEKFGFLLFAGHQRQDYFPLSDDFSSTEIEDGDRRENSYYKKTDLFAKITYHPDQDHHTSVSFSFIDNEKGVPPIIYAEERPPRYWKFPTWRKWIINLSSLQRIGESSLIKAILFYDKYDNILDGYKDATYSTLKFHSTYDDYSFGSNIFLTQNFSEANELTFGINYKRDVHREQGDRGEEWEKYKVNTYTLGAEHELKIQDSYAFSSGLSLNVLHPVYAHEQPLRDDVITLDGRLGFSRIFSPELEIFGSAGHRTRFPTLKELYSGYAYSNIPNPDLKEESAFNFEMGTRYAFSSWGKSELVFFDSEVTDLIVEKLAIPPDTFQMDNVAKARFYGAEFVTTLKPLKNTTLVGSYSYLRARNLSSDRVSDKLEYRPQHRVRLQGEYNFQFGLGLSLTATHVAKRSYLDDEGYDYKLPDYTLINAKLNQSLCKNIALSFDLDNILDEDYQTEYGFPMPGRTFYAGMELDF